MFNKETKQTTGIYYKTDWAHKRWSRKVRSAWVWLFMKPSIGIYGRPKTIGADRLKNVSGPVVFVANHHSHADTTLLLATIPAHLRSNLAIAAGEDYFFPNKTAGFLSALFIGAIPIDRNRISKLSIQNAQQALEAGRNLLIFPEGSRSPAGWNGEHKPGAAFIAKRVGVPLVPIYIYGTGTVLPKGKWWPRKSPCAVVFGAPIETSGKDKPKVLAARSQAAVAQLADEFRNGWWSSIRNANKNETQAPAPEASAWRQRWASHPEDSK